MSDCLEELQQALTNEVTCSKAVMWECLAHSFSYELLSHCLLVAPEMDAKCIFVVLTDSTCPKDAAFPFWPFMWETKLGFNEWHWLFGNSLQRDQLISTLLAVQ